MQQNFYVPKIRHRKKHVLQYVKCKVHATKCQGKCTSVI